MIAGIHEQGGIFKTEMSGSSPSGVSLNGDEWFVGPGLHPPRAAPCVDDNLLAGMSAGDAAGDGVDSFSAALRRRRNFCELDCGAGGRLLPLATGKQKHEAENYRHRVAKSVRNEPFLGNQI